MGAQLPPCPCGQTHAVRPETAAALADIIAARGELVTVTAGGGSWRVPRVYFVAHRVYAGTLPALAGQYGFTRAREDT